jgi:hypothetical protein
MAFEKKWPFNHLLDCLRRIRLMIGWPPKSLQITEYFLRHVSSLGFLGHGKKLLSTNAFNTLLGSLNPFDFWLPLLASSLRFRDKGEAKEKNFKINFR